MPPLARNGERIKILLLDFEKKRCSSIDLGTVSERNQNRKKNS
jgi:hypothetical protein